jgi:hypothetical protein
MLRQAQHEEMDKKAREAVRFARFSFDARTPG